MSQVKGLAKLGNIVADTNVSQFAVRETYVGETNFAARKQEHVFALSQKHTVFASQTQILLLQHHVSQLSHPRKHDLQQCFRNNVS